MARTQIFLILFFVFSIAILAPLSLIGWLSNPIVFWLLLVGIVIVSIVVAHHRTEQRTGEGEGVWNHIPDWQYEGRFAEAGGLTRSEQSDAIENVSDRAKEIEKAHDRKQRK